MNARNSTNLAWYWIALLGLLTLLSLAPLVYDNVRAGSEPWQLVASTLLLAVPVGLMYASFGLLAACARSRKAQGRLEGRLKTWLYRAPRIAAIVLIVFVSLFSLDAFDLEGSLWMKLGAFVIHSIPSLFMAGLLYLAWRWEWVGFAVFSLAALFFLRTMLFNPLQGLGMVMIFSGPMAGVALLFGANWIWRKEMRGRG